MSALSSATSTRARSPSLSAGVTGAALLSDAVKSESDGSQRKASCRYGVGNGAGRRARSAGAGATSPTGRWAAPKGSRTVNVEPAPSWLSAVIVPPCKATSSLTSASPIPLPSVDRARVVSTRWNRSNSRGSSARGMPIPVSLTVTTASVSSRLTLTVMEPSKVNFSALESRLSTTFSHISRSRYTGSSSGGQSTANVKPARSTADRNTLASSAVTEGKSVGSKRACIRPAWMREKSSRVLTSLVSRKALRWMSSSSARACSSTPVALGRAVRRRVQGLV